jgi:hypothetical protein
MEEENMTITRKGMSYKQTQIVLKDIDENELNDIRYAVLAPIFGFNLKLLADLTKRTSNINTVNISQVKRYRNLISASIYGNYSTIAFFLNCSSFLQFKMDNKKLFLLLLK